MGKHPKKPGIQGLSGSPGKLFFHQHPHRVVAYVAPAPGHASAGQLAERTHFRDAHKYIRAVQHQPEVWAKYKAEASRRHCQPEKVALADFMQAPVIQQVHLNKYRGKAGDPISIVATDSFGVSSVQVAITNGTGEVLEKGPAQQEPGTSLWRFKALKANVAWKGSHIRIEVRDLPGNCTCLEQAL